MSVCILRWCWQHFSILILEFWSDCLFKGITVLQSAKVAWQKSEIYRSIYYNNIVPVRHSNLRFFLCVCWFWRNFSIIGFQMIFKAPYCTKAVSFYGAYCTIFWDKWENMSRIQHYVIYLFCLILILQHHKQIFFSFHNKPTFDATIVQRLKIYPHYPFLDLTWFPLPPPPPIH